MSPTKVRRTWRTSRAWLAREARKPIDTRVIVERLAGLLAVVLVVLVGYLIFMLSTRGTEQAGFTANRVRSIVTIEGPGVGAKPRFSRPMGVAVDAAHNIYVADTGNDRVVVFDRSGKYRFEFGGRGVAKPLPSGVKSWRPGLLNYPVGIDIGDDGLIYVADFRNDQVCVFRRDGTFVNRFPDPARPVGRGSSGQDGRGIAVTDVTVRGGTVYATDTFQVFAFGTDGSLKRQFGEPGRQEGQLDHPNGIGVGADGSIFVSDSNHARMQAFTPVGRVLWALGTPPNDAADQADRVFGLPRGLCVAEDGTIYVADAFNSQVIRVSPEGALLGKWGTQGTQPGSFFFPNDVAQLGAYFVVADKENDRVQVVEFLE